MRAVIVLPGHDRSATVRALAARLGAAIRERHDRVAPDRRNLAVPAIAEANLAGRLVERIHARRRRFVARIDHALPQHPVAGQILDGGQHLIGVARR